MTPKEKANEIFSKMYNEVYDTYGTEIRFIAKQCALIAVNEMLNEYPSQVPKDSYEMERHLYWLEVKKEIEKL
jgi:hypothetical protein